MGGRWQGGVVVKEGVMGWWTGMAEHGMGMEGWKGIWEGNKGGGRWRGVSG